MGSIKKNTYQQIASLYYACVLNREALQLANRSAAVADSVYASVNNKFTEGTVSLPNMDIAKLNSERAQQTAITARYQLRSSQNSLKALLGMTLTDSLAITQQLATGAAAIKAEEFKEDPAIRLAYHQKMVSFGRVKAANAGAFPTLAVLYNNTTQQFDNTFRPFDAAGPQWFPASYWSLRASWSIFNGGSRWLQSQKDKLSYLQSKEDEQQAIRQSAINDDNLRLNYEKATLLLTKAESIMNLSYDNYRHISMRYDEGLASIEDRLRAFTDYINYQNQYLNNLSEMLVQLYNIKLRQQTF
jgi:outer membrane protein TolC